MSGYTTKAAGAATDDPPRPPAEPPSGHEDWHAQGRALPALSGARGTSRPAGRAGRRLYGAVLLAGDLRAQGQQPDLGAADAVVAAPGTVGQLSTRTALSGLLIPTLPVRQRRRCRAGGPRA